MTARDSFVAFLKWRYGWGRWLRGMVKIAPAFLAYARNRDRGLLKAALVREFLSGERRADLAAAADRFASLRARAILRPDAVRCWKRWQKENARLIIVTASPEIVVAPFGRGLGAESVIGTRLAFTEAGLATGALDGPNCRGEEKVARLKSAFGEEVRLEAAYGDSDGDEAMLTLADDPGMKVFGERP